MARASTKSKKKPLRGSVRQQSAPEPEQAPWMTFGMRLGLLVGGSILLILVVAWIWHSDWPRRGTRSLTQGLFDITRDAHFAVKDIAVEGRVHTDREALSTALGIDAHDAILQIDTEAAHKRLMELPWVENVTIERQLPDRIYIRLVERQPVARWQNDGKTSIIDHEGKVLTETDTEPFGTLPLLAGAGAPEAADTLLKDLAPFPAVTKVMKGAVRVGMRRWDLYLLPKTTARLPETNQHQAIEQLAKLIADDKILEKDVTTIDLRVSGKIVLGRAEAESASPSPPVPPKKENGVSAR